MKKRFAQPWLIFFGALALGVLLHFVYGWLPNSLTALFSPVQESIWEHLKILYFPLLLSALILSRRNSTLRSARLLAIPIVCALMLALAWLYHVVLRGENMVFDLVLYVVLMVVGFLLPRWLWPLGDWPGTTRAAVGLTLVLGLLIVWFTFSPPENVLFATLGGGLRTFLTIPI